MKGDESFVICGQLSGALSFAPVTGSFPFLILLLLCLPYGRATERPYFNDLEVPQSMEDLEQIQAAVQSHLEKARAATVCLQIGEGSGTGVIISPEGLVLTAAHVSGGVRKRLTAVLEDGTEIKARSLGLDSVTDAAMVQLEGEGPFPYVAFDDQAAYRLGDWVFSLGHSGGFDKERGVVVRVGRLVQLMQDTLQSDCVLIGGDSGGPLFNMNGILIGIHSRVGRVKDDSRHVPLASFRREWDEMLAGEFLFEGPFASPYGNGYTGVEVQEDSEAGTLKITEVAEESPGAKAGLEAGMAITKVDGVAVSQESGNLWAALDLSKKIGDEVSLSWSKGGDSGEVTLTLIEAP